MSNPYTTYHKTGGSAQWYANRLVLRLVSTQWYANRLVPALCRSEVTGSFLIQGVPKLGSTQWYANHLVPGLCRSEVTGSFLIQGVPKLGSAQWYANHLVPGLCRSEVTGSFLMHGVPGTRASSCTCTWSPSPSCPGPLASSWTCRPAPWYFHGPHTSRPPSCRQCQVPPCLVNDNGSLPQRGDITNYGSSSNKLLTSVIFLLPCC